MMLLVLALVEVVALHSLQIKVTKMNLILLEICVSNELVLFLDGYSFYIDIVAPLIRYETGNGIKAEETGTLKKASSPDSNDAVIAQGFCHLHR